MPITWLQKAGERVRDESKVQDLRLEDHLELLRMLLQFRRPHRALKFGREVRTPAIQAGLTRIRLTLREIFTSGMVFLASGVIVFVYSATSLSVEITDPRAA